MTRLHPFDFVFAPLAETAFPAIRVDVGDEIPDLVDFAALTRTRELIQELAPGDLPPDALTADNLLRLLYAAWRFWDAGRITLPVTMEGIEREADVSPDDSLPGIPGGAAYLALPLHTFWARIDTDNPWEPLDGLFVSLDRGDHWHVVAILGLRADRYGFSQLVADAHGPRVQEATVGVSRPLFPARVPGGDEAGVRSIATPEELLHLARLALAGAAR